ncbi:MAG TPA: DinB family protein [Candidatus Limnocylindria bacterium]|nr:DinB family protein [Candidatus Limnocylindria bacterium]
MISEREELLKTLRGTPVVLERLVGDVPDEALRARPAPGEWAIIEVVAHLADTDERSIGRMRRMLTEDEPMLQPYDQAALAIERDYIAMDDAEQLARFSSLRAEQVAMLEGLDEAGWSRAGIHGEHGRVTVQQLTAHTAGEDGDHLAQIARLIPRR